MSHFSHCPQCGAELLTGMTYCQLCGWSALNHQAQQYAGRMCPIQYPNAGTRIISCAVSDENGIIYSLPAPARHHSILNTHGGLAQCKQGFLDSNGKFVTRGEAWGIAMAAGQIIRRCGGDSCDGGRLFSENLW